VPEGLPTFNLPSLDTGRVSQLLPTALVIALVGFMELIAVSKLLAARHRYSVHANQELVALGLANFTGALFQAFPVAGGFSRSAINDQSGARTQLASLVTATVVGMALLFLTPLFYYMPSAVLAAIVMVAVSSLIDFGEIAFFWRVRRQDFLMMAVTFAATLALGIKEGILVGVVASIALVVQQSSRPHVARLGKLPGTTTYRKLGRNSEAVEPEGTAIIRVDASLYFANAELFKDIVAEAARDTEGITAVVLDLYPVNRVDATVVRSFLELIEYLSEARIELLVAGAQAPVVDVMERGGVVDAIGRANFFHETHQAVEEATRRKAAALGDPRSGETSPAKAD